VLTFARQAPRLYVIFGFLLVSDPHAMLIPVRAWTAMQTLLATDGKRSIGRASVRMTTTALIIKALAAVLVAQQATGQQASQSPSFQQPNIVIILADDLGAHDLGCYGADLIETPELDRFAQTALRFTQAYAPSPVCSPTRAALLTGKHPARLKMTIWSEGAVSGPKDRKLEQAFSRHDLPLEEITLAEILQKAGYVTASVGKWHLGDANHAPETQGFDLNIGGNHWGAPTSFFYPYRGPRSNGEFRYLPNLAFGKPGEYLTDRLTDEALRVIDHATEQQRPFFLLLSHHAPHTPIEAKPEMVESFERKRRPEFRHQHAAYAAMIKSLDESAGRVLERLEQLNLSDSTIVIFTSDNGGYIAFDEQCGAAITTNWPLRSGKGSLYEGGLRVPLIVRAPSLTQSQSVSAEPVVLTDLFPTLLEAARVGYESATTLDGASLVELLRRPSSRVQRDALYFHYPHYYHAPATTPVSAIIEGEWKLIENYEDSSLELYNLATDPSEQTNLIEHEEALVSRLQTKLHDWQRSVDAELPTLSQP
jgi:arylsulfatase A